MYRNSIYLIASTGILAFFGFWFWIIAANLFKTEYIGIATTLISVTTLISSFALLGLNISFIRYFPKSEKKGEMITTSFMLVSLASIIATVIFLLNIDLFSPQLAFLTRSGIYMFVFALLIVVMALSNILDSIYMALRNSENILLRNTVLSISKLLFILLFVGLGAFGIFSSFALAVTVSFLAGTVLLIRKFHFKMHFTFDVNLIKKLGIFSIGNYVAGFLYQAPLLVLPLIIINSLQAKSAAYYYIDSMILNLITVIPISASQSLLTEGSHDDSMLREHLKKSIKITGSLLLPCIPIVIFFGGFILHFFGKDYQADALSFLQILTASSIFMSVILFGNSILRIQKRVKALIFLNLSGCVIVLASSYSFIGLGLVGVGWGWLTGQIATAALYLVFLVKSLNKN